MDLLCVIATTDMADRRVALGLAGQACGPIESSALNSSCRRRRRQASSAASRL